uniref:ATP synthase subunit 8 n=1 Tax=Epitrimerus sabinae TaxID=1452570 RepID=A0A0U2HVH6_9ACAR|nr:ATP synthase F0 subunit 8 [Epitrimerus sabinae]ALK03785.1 ATP synthase subunit 8 [Epitrimerus sabinae]
MPQVNEMSWDLISLLIFFMAFIFASSWENILQLSYKTGFIATKEYFFFVDFYAS